MGNQLAHLLHLASPALPVGAFSYSQGLEQAIEHKPPDMEGVDLARQWIADTLHFSLIRCEAPMMVAMMKTWNRRDSEKLAELNETFVALRETAELRAETLQMGHSLARLLHSLDGIPEYIRNTLHAMDETAYPTVWAAAASHWQLSEADAAQAYLWAWLENQIMAAVKLVPLGQTQGQKILLQLAADLPALAHRAINHAEDDWENFTPGLAIASSLHETLYTRLFRS